MNGYLLGWRMPFLNLLFRLPETLNFLKSSLICLNLSEIKVNIEIEIKNRFNETKGGS